MKNNSLIYLVVITIIAVVGGFFGGFKYRDYQLQQNRQFFTGQFSGGMQGRFNRQGNSGMMSGPNGRNGFRPINGEIIKQEGQSVTVKMADSSSKIIILNEKTVYNRTQSAQKTDLKVGETIGVFGTENTDGSITAQNIQINPQFRGTTNTVQQ